MVSFSFCLASVRENNWKNVCWKTALFSLFSTHAYQKGGVKYSYYVLVIYVFFTLPRFSYMVSELDYSLLKHVGINDDL